MFDIQPCKTVCKIFCGVDISEQKHVQSVCKGMQSGAVPMMQSCILRIITPAYKGRQGFICMQMNECSTQINHSSNMHGIQTFEREKRRVEETKEGLKGEPSERSYSVVN